jgi:hypothetical protein
MRAHHSICDGASTAALQLSWGDTYDLNCMMPIRKISFLERWFVRLTFLFYIPKTLWDALNLKIDKNPLHDGVRELSGIKKAACSNEFMFIDVKSAAKKLKITINDLLTACLSSAMK